MSDLNRICDDGKRNKYIVTGGPMEKWKEGFENLKKIKLQLNTITSILVFGVLMVFPYLKLEMKKNENLGTALLVENIIYAMLWVVIYFQIRRNEENKEVFQNRYSHIIFLCIILAIGLPIIIL